MKLENQVCSLELAKKLKELGVKQESLWWWNIYNQNGCDAMITLNRPERKGDYCCSAFTVTELGEMLPNYVGGQEISTRKDVDNNYWCELLGDDTKEKYFKSNAEANARAKMLIYLIENKLMETK